jgi:pilus assembly protein CpaC
VRGRDQVMLKVTVAEVQRDIIKQLGVDLNGNLNYGTSVVNLNNITPFSVTGKQLVDTNAVTAGLAVSARRCAQWSAPAWCAPWPNRTLTAISGEAANFLAGGEFPIPKGVNCDPITRMCSPFIEFKKFGIALNFTPVVMASRTHQPARIHRSLGNFGRQLASACRVDELAGDLLAHDSVGQDPSRGEHA